jgi:hypothetical protein
MIDLQTAPIGTPHDQSTCCWCGYRLVVGQVDQLRCWLCPVDYRRQVEKSLRVVAGKGDHARLLGVKAGTTVCLHVPLPSQAAFEECTATNVLWGGQAGPGKSFGVRKFLYKRALTIPNYEGLLLRENWAQLEKTHIRAMARELPLLGARMSDFVARFPNGSVIDCGHMADAEAVSRYLSTEYVDIVPEEASLYPVNADGTTPLAELSTRARKSLPDVQGVMCRPRFLPVTNPGGPSAQWLREMFVDHAPDYDKFPALADEGAYDEADWVYIPARLDDNPYQASDYRQKRLSVLSKTRYEQLARGDWHVFAGQFFAAWSDSRHVRTLHISPYTEWFASMDWGYNAPGCVLWWACLPDGHYHIAQEFKFQGLDPNEVADQIKKRNTTLGIKKLRHIVADPAMWQKTGAGVKGQSIAETMLRRGMPMRPGDNDRLNGWARCQSMLRADDQGVPWLTVDETCPYLKRTIPAAVSDKKNAEDVDTAIDDHALDAWRYGAMSRPHPTRLVTPEKPKGSIGKLMDDLLAEVAVA